MSNFKCSKCGTDIIDSPKGYVTFCKHYPKCNYRDQKCSDCSNEDCNSNIINIYKELKE